MPLEIKYTKRMRQDIKRAAKQGRDMSKLEYVLDTLADERILPSKYKDHKLTGDKANFRECHIENDWLLMYRIFDDTLILSAIATGTHSDLLDL
jgi:mRNA interferase YafQ